MRLKIFEVKAIKGAVSQLFGQDAKVYLFGSRVDDKQKGGNIDLYIVPKDQSEQGLYMSAPSKAKAIKLDNPAQKKASHQSGTELHIMQGNEHYEAVVRAVYQPQRE
ncbi:nucleotidyltransferase domain-containing protein [Facilibium subflavum]|uniref:nucleotidyltransferase domain-containing protein n=1 Tax=Facilibium subflavum TaxID=2219058 RepID=UPI000E648C25|nr:nucleotidyltransferase domain-containing protein [Facilibium subflavum]